MVQKPKWCIPHQILHRIALLSRPLVSMETRALRRAKWKVVSTHSDQCSVCPLQLFFQRLQFRQIFGQGMETKDMKDPQTKRLQLCMHIPKLVFIYNFPLLRYSSVHCILLQESPLCRLEKHEWERLSEQIWREGGSDTFGASKVLYVQKGYTTPCTLKPCRLFSEGPEIFLCVL